MKYFISIKYSIKGLMKKAGLLFLTLYLSGSSADASGRLNIAVLGESQVRSEIESKLVGTDFAQPVEREKLDAVFRELKLGQSGILKEGTFVKAGELSGSDFFIITEKDRSFRLVHSRSGKVYGSWKEGNSSSYSELSERLEAEKVMRDLVQLNEKSRKLKIHQESSFEGKILVGESIKLVLKLSSASETLKRAYVTVLYYGQDGSILQIFPNKYDTDSLVDINQEFTVPRDEKKYRLQADHPAGEDTIVIIASDVPVGLTGENSSYVGPYLMQKKSSKGTKGISIQLNKGNVTAVKKIVLNIQEK